MSAVTLALVLSSAQTGEIKRMPIGWPPRPPRTELRLTPPRTDGRGFETTVTNEGSTSVVGMTFVAVVDVLGTNRPVQVLKSGDFVFSLAPGQKVRLADDQWLTAAQIDQLIADAAPNRVQGFVTPSLIRYADGTVWTLDIDTSKTRHWQALRKDYNFPQP